MASGKARTEIACALSWFRNWNEEQKREFAQVLIDRDRPPDMDQSLECLMSTMTQMSLDKQGPSVFECQLKIFSKWHICWSPSDRTEFIIQLNTIAPEFIASVNAQLR